ncbi:glycoside hydrolase family 16 protein [Nocardioides piscis]|uniref:Glycoside hydrolase family 16 protein n=1 Tax=Nocardioides piscis TaxID=2714938 RepID=A0A6G7YE93_9ACTN|nr:glycoside hydrolase family 16 protein [Nocardioides piscis]QIK75224.1 glycoside hydrolase family 16 protein [Nocardioides piscis]
MRRSQRTTIVRRLTTLATAAVCITALAACAEDAKGKTSSLTQADYEDGEGISATVLPQLAAPGDDVQASTDADFVVDATVQGAEAGRTVELQVAEGDEWRVKDSAETDADGRVSLTTGAAEEFRVIALGDKPVGINLSTAEAPAEIFVDEFDAQDPAAWATRDQGYAGVRMCSKASDDAAQWVDGVVRLSVLDDPDKGDCTYKKDKFAYRLNGHIGSTFNFTYGHAAARIKFQELRGQHGAFWLQGLGTVPVGDPMDTGAEIDVIEYFGDDHPDGGLTSFIYWHPTAKGKMAGGWLKKPEQYGDDWSKKFHVFSVEWTPEEYVFRIDGQVTNTITEGISGRPEFLVLSLLSSDYEIQHLQGDENLPQHMDVDWVKVWAPTEA